MRSLDETDLEILQLLVEDSRRPYSEIAEHVGLTPPAVSDRVTRLEELGVIQNFTLHIDRTMLQNRTPILLQLTVKPDAVERTFERITKLDGKEHVFQQFDGGIIAHVKAPDRDVHSWLRDVLDMEDITSYELTQVAKHEWCMGIEPTDFALSCTVCENTVGSDGETARINGKVKVFCCSSCKGKYEQRYESLQQETN